MTLLVETRVAMHQLARFVLAAELEGTTELVTLRVTPGGFGQPERVVDGVQRRVRVDGAQLVIQHGEQELWMPITTLRAAADAAAVVLGDDVPSPDAPLPVDQAQAARLGRFFALVDTALAELRRRHASDGPTIVQLFPHHFDLAITLNEVNVGGSPGDDDHDRPYLYIGPWSLSPHEAWNESWGASLTCSEHMTANEAVAFFESGLLAASAR